MDFLVVANNNTIHDISIFISEFCEILAQGHDVWFYGNNPLIKFEGQLHKEETIVPGKYDGAYIMYFKLFPEIDCPIAYFVQNDIVGLGLIQNIENVIANGSNFTIVSNSDFQKQQLLDIGISSDLIVNIPTYINELVFKPVDNYPKIERSIILINVNNYSEQITPLIEAMILMPDYRLTILSDTKIEE